jgi:hypothetical protein
MRTKRLKFKGQPLIEFSKRKEAERVAEEIMNVDKRGIVRGPLARVSPVRRYGKQTWKVWMEKGWRQDPKTGRLIRKR